MGECELLTGCLTQLVMFANCLRMYCLPTFTIPFCELKILATSSLALMSLLSVSYLL